MPSAEHLYLNVIKVVMKSILYLASTAPSKVTFPVCELMNVYGSKKEPKMVRMNYWTGVRLACSWH